MQHTQQQHKHGGILYPLLLVAAIAVIVFSIIGIASMTGVIPAAVRDSAERQSGEQPKGKPARIETPGRDRMRAPGNPRTASIGRQHQG